jgi:membrane protease YdiL (CAAX protease family)
MTVTLSRIFLTRHRDLRVVWRMVFFLFIASAGVLGGGYLLHASSIQNEAAGYILAILSVALATFVMTRFVNRKPFSAVGLAMHSGAFRDAAMGCLLGFLMMAGIFTVEYGLGFLNVSLRNLAPFDVLKIGARSLLLFALSAVFEEFTFRGYLFQTLIQGISFLPATLLFALFFAFAHVWNPNVSLFGLVNVGVAGILLSIAYMKTRCLWLPIGLHFSWNFSQTTVFSFPTSGIEFSGRSLLDLTQSGPVWITGGAFGPEGGILATLALVVCTGHVLKSSMYQTPGAIVTLDSLEDLLPADDGRGEAA